MGRRMSVLALLGLLGVFLASAGGAQSLWQDGGSLFADQKPSKVGDIVTVLVKEKTATKDEAKTDVSKTNDSSIADGWGLFSFIKALGFKSDSSTKGDGSTERTHTATARVTCLVTEVLPNGNLVIEGGRDLKTHDETLKLRFRGVVRPSDIGSDNVVLSDLVANAEVGIEGKGALTRVQRPGVLTQIFQVLF